MNPYRFSFLPKPVIFLAAAAFPLFLLSCDSKTSSTSSGAKVADETPAEAPPPPPLTTVTLNAFGDFSCTSNWTNRDGALGLSAGSREGTCTAKFPGESGSYRISFLAQTEFDGASPYRIYINGQIVASGRYPYSTGTLYCACPLDRWHTVCPDRNITIDAGVHTINKGDVIKLYGAEDYGCGEHGAYTKWHYMTFSPAG